MPRILISAATTFWGCYRLIIEHSTVTYTSASEDDLYMGSPGIEVPVFEVPPSPDYIPGPEGPPSPDYVPGPEEPEQAPPSPIYIPFSPGYISESDPEEDQEEDDEEDPEEDPADYPADRGDDRDDEEPSDDDDDDAEEEEHLAPTDPAAVGPATARADLYRFADMIDAAPGHQTSRELGYGIMDTWDDLVGAIQEITPTTLEEVNQRVIELVTTVDQEDEIIYSQLDDARYDRALLRARVNMLYRDRPFHRRTTLLMEEEARLSRAAWARSMDACDQVHSEGISLRTTIMAQQSEITELQAADRRRQSMVELQRQQGPAKAPAEPELPEEASSSS
ncbi:hypothetical protein Tco_0339365 [Tanacetum coccineum]